MLADLVRTDRHNHRPLEPDSERLEAVKVRRANVMRRVEAVESATIGVTQQSLGATRGR